MARVVVGPPLDLARPHRQEWLGPIERLDLTLLVHAQHQRAVWRLEVQADDIPHLLDEERVGGQLEGLGPMGLQREGAPDAMHRAPAEPAGLGHRPRAPVRGVGRGGLKRSRQHALDLRIGDRPRGARPRLIQEPVEPPAQKSRAPLADGLLGQPQLVRHHGVRLARGTAQDQARALRHRLRGLRASRPALQRLAFGVGERQRRNRSASAHRCSPFYRENVRDVQLVSRSSETGH